jgi:[ribosomal protein S18]-alanine N-acetyltransferase
VRYTIDRMTMPDVPRVIDIERLAYSSPWPTSAYRKELQENHNAHYIVVRDGQIAEPPALPVERPDPLRRPFPFSLLPAKQTPVYSRDAASIVGFAGLWLMVDESHITTIAVHPAYRSRGLGELLLNSLVGISYEISARHVTLEVRVSNTVAQNLYRKYGFEIAGTRRRYYSDNQEDAFIMTTGDLHAQAYRERFVELRTRLLARLAKNDEGAASPAGQQGAGGVA